MKMSSSGSGKHPILLYNQQNPRTQTEIPNIAKNKHDKWNKNQSLHSMKYWSVILSISQDI